MKPDKKRQPAAENGGSETPAYLRLAESLRQDILDGTYGPGGRIPAESALVKSSGLALLTVRQALGVLVEEGLLERFPGRGTFVKELSWRGALFSIDGLVDRVGGKDTRVRIVRTEVRRAGADIAAKLGVSLGDSVVYLKRAISAEGRVFLVQEGHLLLDPERPIMEAELEATYLTGLLTGSGNGLIKTARLFIAPVILNGEDGRLLELPAGTAAFRLEYVFFDAAASPLAVGSFVAPQEALTLGATIGVRLNNTRST